MRAPLVADLEDPPAFGGERSLVDQLVARLARLEARVQLDQGIGPEQPAIQGPVTVGSGSIWTVNIERDAVFRIAP